MWGALPRESSDMKKLNTLIRNQSAAETCGERNDQNLRIRVEADLDLLTARGRDDGLCPAEPQMSSDPLLSMEE